MEFSDAQDVGPWLRQYGCADNASTYIECLQQMPVADGLAVDSEGRLYVATNVGVEVFSPQGELLGVIPAVWGTESFNLRKPQNVAFAGPDRRTLYMVGSGAVFKIQTLAQGLSNRAK